MNLFKRLFAKKEEKKRKPVATNAGYVSGCTPRQEPYYYESTPVFYEPSAVVSDESPSFSGFGGGDFGGSGASSSWDSSDSSSSYDSGSSDYGSSDSGSSSCD